MKLRSENENALITMEESQSYFHSFSNPPFEEEKKIIESFFRQFFIERSTKEGKINNILHSLVIALSTQGIAQQ